MPCTFRGQAGLIFICLWTFSGSLWAAPTFQENGAAAFAGSGIQRTQSVVSTLPMSFEPNEGQAGEGIKFLARGPRYQLSLLREGPQLELFRQKVSHETTRQKIEYGVLRLNFIDGNRSARLEGLSRLPGRVNYLFGSNPAHWHTNIAIFSQVAYRNTY